MISSHLEGADLESRVASWAASATSDDAAAVRAVIEAYSDRLAAADVADVVSQHTGDAAVKQPELETVIGSQQLTATYHAAVRSGTHGGPLEDHAVHLPADAGAVRRGLLRHLASPPPGFGHFPDPLAVAEHDAAPTVTLIYLPVQGPCR
jgi:hypothetical protein